jgi:hypothetical protein
MDVNLTDNLTFVGQAALASAATLWVASTKIGERLLNHRLEKQLAKFKHEQDQAIEGLRAELAHIADRGKHSNQREFDALSGLWEQFVDAFLSTNTAVVRFMGTLI